MVVEGKVPTEHHQTGASETDLTAVADVICDEITADESNAPARIRTLDPLIKSHTGTVPNHRKNKDLRPISPAGRSAGRSADATGGSEGGPPPQSDLETLVAAWPTLPDHIRAAIRALVGTVG